MERKKGFAAAFAAGLLWGASSPIAQYLFEDKGIVSEWLVPYRLLSAGILLFLYALLIRRQEPFGMWKNKEDALRQIAFAVLGMMGMQYTFFAAVQETNAGTATVFQYLNPAMLILYFAVIYRVAPKAKEIIAVLCSVSGILLVVTHGNLNALSVSPKGILLGLLVALTTCFYGVIPGPLLKKFPAEMVCAWAMLIGGAEKRGFCVQRTFVQRGTGSCDDSGCHVPGNNVPDDRSGGICVGIVYAVYPEHPFQMIPIFILH